MKRALAWRWSGIPVVWDADDGPAEAPAEAVTVVHVHYHVHLYAPAPLGMGEDGRVIQAIPERPITTTEGETGTDMCESCGQRPEAADGLCGICITETESDCEDD